MEYNSYHYDKLSFQRQVRHRQLSFGGAPPPEGAAEKICAGERCQAIPARPSGNCRRLSMWAEKGSRMSRKKIKDFITALEEKCKDGQYIFRGTNEVYSNQKDGISSSLYREHEGTEYQPDLQTIRIEQDIVERARKHFPDKASNIEILTDLRHFGGKITLIDFSRNPYVALFFACSGQFDQDGELILVKADIDASGSSLRKFEIFISNADGERPIIFACSITSG